MSRIDSANGGLANKIHPERLQIVHQPPAAGKPDLRREDSRRLEHGHLVTLLRREIGEPDTGAPAADHDHPLAGESLATDQPLLEIVDGVHVRRLRPARRVGTSRRRPRR